MASVRRPAVALRWASVPRTTALRHYRTARGPRISRHREPIHPAARPAQSARPTKPSPLYPDQHQHWNSYDQFPSSQQEQTPTEASQVPVIVPVDPNSIVQPDSPAATLLSQSGLVVVRQLEMLIIGFEQANKYAVMDASGQTVGYIAEEEAGLASTIGRQVLRTHRPFKCTVMDASGNVIFRVNRPFSFINSRITISLGDDPNNVVGECQQEWHPWRRRYNLFVKRDDNYEQFARVDAGLLSWTFDAMDRDNRIMASINRNWGGFGRELFTDTGQYALKFDAVALEAPTTTSSEERAVEVHSGLTLDQRAVLLATAVTTDIDYFSRHSGHGGGFGFMPIMFPFGGGAGEVEPGPLPSEESPPLREADDDTPLPRSEEADEVAASRGWDSWESDIAQRQADEQMSDPWATGDESPGWDDFFGDQGDGDNY